MKKFLLIIISLLMSGNFYGCENSTNRKKIISTSKEKKITINSKTKNTPPDSKTRILGKWYFDGDRTSYWIFKDDGKVYSYEEDILF